MKVVAFLNNLGLGGTEKAACRWARGLQENGHEITMLSLADGPRRSELEAAGVTIRVSAPIACDVASALRELSPEAIHAHVPGHPHVGDVLGEALATLPKIPVVQTNVFGHLTNPKEDAWTDFRLFVSWTSCVQAARRAGRRLDESFFRRASVAVYPVDPLEAASPNDVAVFRKRVGVRESEVLFGRLSRPDPNKWTELALEAFQIALQCNRTIKLLLREPPPAVAERLRASRDASRFVILPATADPEELRLTISALDVVLHTSSIGESFGYGIAEPMNLGKPVISHSVPWADQAQIELVRNGECGFIASTPSAMAHDIEQLAASATLREKMGTAGQQHIRSVANPELSLKRVETACEAVIKGGDNDSAAQDVAWAKAVADYLNQHQFGHSLREQSQLRWVYYRARLCERLLKLRLRLKPANLYL